MDICKRLWNGGLLYMWRRLWEKRPLAENIQNLVTHTVVIALLFTATYHRLAELYTSVLNYPSVLKLAIIRGNTEWSSTSSF